MAGKDIILEKFSGHIARDWTDWLHDYECYADMKKWNEARHIQKITFLSLARFETVCGDHDDRTESD